MARRNRGKRATTSQRGRMSNARAGERPVIQPGCLPVQAVLGQPELLEYILDFAIHDKNVETRVKTLSGVRLVNKSWLLSVTQLMRANKEPMFKLNLTQENSLNGTPTVEAQGKCLDKFCTIIANRLLKKPFPTFSLNMMKEFFRRENYDSLVTFLRLCAEGLVKLEMFVPKNAGSLPGVLPIVDLPLLKNISIALSTDHKVAENLSGIELDFGNSTNVICLLHSFLSRAQSLKEFSFPWIIRGNNRLALLAPPGFEILSLPTSITSLELKCEMSSDQLKLLVRNKLPSLLKLEILMKNMSYTEGLLSDIFTNFCEHLRFLMITGNTYVGPPRITNLVRFPEMKQLIQLTITNYGFELEDDHPMLNTCFPKLKKLYMLNQTPEMLRKWACGAPVNSVKGLCVSLVDESKPEHSSGYVLPLNLEYIQSVKITFPNVRELTIRICTGTQTSGLKYLFMEMRQLTSLGIMVDGSESIVNSDCWDSILTGAPVPVIAGLRESPDFWNKLELKDEVASIKMLTELLSLTLHTVVSNTNAEVMQPLISDLAFTFGLLKMPKLKNLYLYGRFSASNLMTETWKQNGRRLQYKLTS